VLSLTNHRDIDWIAQLGRPRAVRLVYMRPSRRGRGLPRDQRQRVNVPPDYHRLHWRHPHIQGIAFGELDSYNMAGLSAMIIRRMPHDRIRYIIGATSAGRRSMRSEPDEPLTGIDYMFIQDNETVRAWLLSNPVADDPLDLMVYLHRDPGDDRPTTPAARGVPYFDEGEIRDFATEPRRIGQIHLRDMPPDAAAEAEVDLEAVDAEGRAENAEIHEAIEMATGPDKWSNLGSISGQSSASPSGASDGLGSAISPAAVVDPNGSPSTRSPLASKAGTLLNRQRPYGIPPSPGEKVRKRRALFEQETVEAPSTKKPRLGVITGNMIYEAMDIDLEGVDAGVCV